MCLCHFGELFAAILNDILFTFFEWKKHKKRQKETNFYQRQRHRHLSKEGGGGSHHFRL